MCKLTKYMSKLQIFLQSLQGKISTAGKKISQLEKKISTTAGRDGHDKFQVCIQHVQSLKSIDMKSTCSVF